jgi:hypothetical protein
MLRILATLRGGVNPSLGWPKVKLYWTFRAGAAAVVTEDF